MADFDKFATIVLSHEELIATCMRERGFEYIAHLPSDIVIERAATLAVARGESGEIDPNTLNLPQDPNLEAVQALDPAAQEAYADAYWGSSRSEGCYDSTYAEAWGVENPFISPTDAESRDLTERAEASLVVQNAERHYLRCMADEGYIVTSVDDYNQLLAEESEVVTLAAVAADVGFEEVPEYETFRAYERALLDHHDSCFDAYGDARDQAIRDETGD